MNKNLDQIARDYHNASLPDMHIEEACQLYELDWILSYLVDSESKVLDLGFGDGINFAPLARSSQLTLVEGSLDLCEEARRQSDLLSLNVDVVHSLFEDFRSDTKFDIIVASHVLEHVDNPVALLRHLQTLLNYGGRVIGIVPNAESFHRKLGVAIGLQEELDELSQRDHLVGHQRVYSLKTLRADCKSSGMDLIEHRGFFLKVLSNSQMLHLDLRILNGLLKISDNLPTEYCANIGFAIQAIGDLDE
jgi:2-polyprenyl-3-methyl-5-hydroxy-6-metoxy-1,4-benzoquinol methylase